MIDSHCHLGFQNQPTEQVVAQAGAAGIQKMLTVACEPADYTGLLSILDTYPQVYGAFGIYPEYADKFISKQEFFDLIQSHKKIVAVGEIGLEYHYHEQDKHIQRRIFEQQLEWARELNKPVIIHAREADEDMIAVLDSAYRGGLLTHSGVIHCFTGSQKLADKALEIGFYISVSGVITFKNADSIRAVVQSIPLDRLLVETDAPYMAPVPYRGQENQPAFVLKTAEKLAEIKGTNITTIDLKTTSNFNKLFHIKEAKNEN